MSLREIAAARERPSGLPVDWMEDCCSTAKCEVARAMVSNAQDLEVCRA